MSNLSVRLPEHLEHELGQEARRLKKRRSEVVREAVAEYIQRRAQQRFMTDMVAEMRDWLGDESARADSNALSKDFPDDGLESLIANEQKDGTDADTPWWK